MFNMIIDWYHDINAAFRGPKPAERPSQPPGGDTAMLAFWRELNAALDRRDHEAATWSQTVRAWAQGLSAGEAAAIIVHRPELL